MDVLLLVVLYECVLGYSGIGDFDLVEIGFILCGILYIYIGC